MRLLIRLTVIFAVLWCAWWALASYGVSRGIDGWVAARTDEGWRAKVTSGQAGFPLNIRTKLALVDVDNPISGTGVTARGATVSARTYWPGTIDVALPDTPISLRGPAGISTLAVKNGQLALRLRAGLALELRRVAFISRDWVYKVGDIDMLRGNGLVVSATQPARGSGRYDFAAEANGLGPGDTARQLFGLSDAFPPTFQTFTVTGAVNFDTPLSGLSSDATPPPQITQIVVERGQVVWGSIALSVLGAIDVDAQGIPTGKFELQAKDWRNLLELAVATGAVEAESRIQTEFTFRLLASRGGSPDNIDLDLVFQDGQMTVSDIPLGPAPRIVLQ